MGTKTCTKCGVEKLLTEFYDDPNQRGKMHSWCKSCVKGVGKRTDGVRSPHKVAVFIKARQLGLDVQRNRGSKYGNEYDMTINGKTVYVKRWGDSERPYFKFTVRQRDARPPDFVIVVSETFTGQETFHIFPYQALLNADGEFPYSVYRTPERQAFINKWEVFEK